jgi:hypothetical protein
MAEERVVRIGGASGFWGDSSVGAPQLVAAGVDYLVFDYLAELTMSIMAGQRAKKPELGYATDFVTVAMRSVLRDLVARRIKVVSNAGGLNPQACAAALAALAKEIGVSVRIGVVTGDDVLAQTDELRASGTRDLITGRPLPGRLMTANAYLGAVPIKAALDAGADIVVTGRCVDSAVTLGALMHAFGWRETDYDLLAQGSLAGHIIECGCQATGGLHTDWERVPDWANIGYPIVECRVDGSVSLTKPPGTGGIVHPPAVAEQILYEIGDPARYILPDVICDFTDVRLSEAGAERVQISGARGLPPTGTYKVSATWMDGYRCSAQLTIIGFDATAKARRTGEAIIERTRALFAKAGFADYVATNIEVLGAESIWGPLASEAARGVREAVMRVSVMHGDKRALEIFAREVAPAGTSWSPGTTGGGMTRPEPLPCIKQSAFLMDKARVQPSVVVDGREVQVPPTTLTAAPRATLHPRAPVDAVAPPPDAVTVPLVSVAYGRSGDKGDISNIGIIARRPELLPYLRSELTEARVAAHLAHLVKGKVTRYDLPGLDALNFVCEQALGGGGAASLRNDPLGKGMAQILLAMPVKVPRELLGN